MLSMFSKRGVNIFNMYLSVVSNTVLFYQSDALFRSYHQSVCSFHLKTCLEAVCLLDIQTESDIRLLLFLTYVTCSLFSW